MKIYVLFQLLLIGFGSAFAQTPTLTDRAVSDYLQTVQDPALFTQALNEMLGNAQALPEKSECSGDDARCQMQSIFGEVGDLMLYGYLKFHLNASPYQNLEREMLQFRYFAKEKMYVIAKTKHELNDQHKVWPKELLRFALESVHDHPVFKLEQLKPFTVTQPFLFWEQTAEELAKEQEDFRLGRTYAVAAANSNIQIKSDRFTLQDRDLVWHELSHVFASFLTLSTTLLPVSEDYLNLSEFKKIENQKLGDGRDKFSVKNPHSCVSDYTRTHPDEDFAESVTAYFYHSEKLKQASIPKYDFIKNVVYFDSRFVNARDQFIQQVGAVTPTDKDIRECRNLDLNYLMTAHHIARNKITAEHEANFKKTVSLHFKINDRLEQRGGVASYPAWVLSSAMTEPSYIKTYRKYIKRIKNQHSEDWVADLNEFADSDTVSAYYSACIQKTVTARISDVAERIIFEGEFKFRENQGEINVKRVRRAMADLLMNELPEDLLRKKMAEFSRYSQNELAQILIASYGNLENKFLYRHWKLLGFFEKFHREKYFFVENIVDRYLFDLSMRAGKRGGCQYCSYDFDTFQFIKACFVTFFAELQSREVIPYGELKEENYKNYVSTLTDPYLQYVLRSTELVTNIKNRKLYPHFNVLEIEKH